MDARMQGQTLESHEKFQYAPSNDIFTGRLKEKIPDGLRSINGGIILADVKLAELDLSDSAFWPVGIELSTTWVLYAMHYTS